MPLSFAQSILGEALDLALAPIKHERVTRASGHRPWPLPARAWVMGQTWCDLLFAHWPVPVEALTPVMPPQLEPETYEGSAWIAVTPFEVRNLRLRPTWPLPMVSRFPEINVRTYVSVGGKPGIYFFSLDAASGAAVAAARHFYRLPYFHARMAIECDAGQIRYRSVRISGGKTPPAGFIASYRARGQASAPTPGTLEHWLTERYSLYTLDGRGRVLRAEIHHPPWPLQSAEAEIEHNTMAEPIGVALSGEPLLHYAARQEVVFWTLKAAS